MSEGLVSNTRKNEICTVVRKSTNVRLVSWGEGGGSRSSNKCWFESAGSDFMENGNVKGVPFIARASHFVVVVVVGDVAKS